jgi:hypothetical protein
MCFFREQPQKNTYETINKIQTTQMKISLKQISEMTKPNIEDDI